MNFMSSYLSVEWEFLIFSFLGVCQLNWLEWPIGCGPRIFYFSFSQGSKNCMTLRTLTASRTSFRHYFCFGYHPNCSETTLRHRSRFALRFASLSAFLSTRSCLFSRNLKIQGF